MRLGGGQPVSDAITRVTPATSHDEDRYYALERPNVRAVSGVEPKAFECRGRCNEKVDCSCPRSRRRR